MVVSACSGALACASVAPISGTSPFIGGSGSIAGASGGGGIPFGAGGVHASGGFPGVGGSVFPPSSGGNAIPVTYAKAVSEPARPPVVPDPPFVDAPPLAAFEPPELVAPPLPASAVDLWLAASDELHAADKVPIRKRDDDLLMA